MSNEKNILPDLRFPEFDKDGDWKTEPLGEVADVYQPKTISQSDLSENGYPVYGANGTIGFYHEYNHETNQIAIACRGSSCGTVNFTKPKSWVTGNAMVVNVDQFNQINKEFMFFQLHYANLDYLVSGSGQPQITGSIKKHEVLLPPRKEEQQKIASCLSSLDELIIAHNQKLEALKNHKKGLMQNLFPQEGKKVPNYRFPEFEKDGVWSLKTIEDVFSIFQGYAFSSKDIVSTGTRWLKIADVGIQEMKHDTPSYLPESFKDEYQRFLLKKGDYVLALTRPILSGKLKIAPVDETYHNSLLNQRVGKLVTSNVISFVYYLIQTSSIIENISRNIAGNEPPNLSFQQISDIAVFIPKEKEQQKIASCLSAVDELITAQKEKIEQLQQHKKGLMQGLFPNPSASSGETIEN